MRLVDLINESLHDVLTLLKSDAEQLEQLDRIELKEDWEEELPRLAHRYEKDIRRVFNSFDDPEGADEHKWIDAHLDATENFLIAHRLARKIG